MARPRTYGPRSLAALGLVMLVLLLSWTGLFAFKRSLSLSSFQLSGKPKTTFDVFRCDASHRYRSGRFNDKTGIARVTVPFGCWEVRPEDGDTSGLQRQTFTVASGSRDALAGGILGAAGLAALALLYPVFQALRHSRRAVRHAAADEVIEARIQGDSARQWTSYAFGFGAAVAVVASLLWFMSLAHGEVRTPFFNFTIVGRYFGQMLKAFVRNIKIFLVAEVFVLIWGLIVAIGRLTPGKAGAPVRWLAVGYIDMFRGLPAVIVLFLIDFGLKKSGIPGISKLDDFWYAVMALTLTYGAYVAEVYRAGIQTRSIGARQRRPARSACRYMQTHALSSIVPQAVRRHHPAALLNDFIGLQKDTALVNVIGAMDVVQPGSKIIEANRFQPVAE